MFIRKLVLPILLPLSTASAEVKAVYTQAGSGVTTTERLPALYVPAGQSANPQLEPGNFAVTWSGNLVIDKRQRLIFAFAGKGEAKLTIDGKEILAEAGELGTEKSKQLRLNSGDHPFTVTYQAPPEEEARFQLLWEERAFPQEPIPPSAFSPGEEITDPVAEGQAIFARHLCVKCHVATPAGPNAMPELMHVPPILGLTGDRLNENWLAHWIADPAAFRPDTNMPRLFSDDEEGRQEAADVAKYLMETWKTGAPVPEIPAGTAKDGGATFHALGCVACHGLPQESAPSENRVPLAHVAEKFQPHSLFDFLKNPAKLSPHTRMPDFRLSDAEAADLTAFLLETTAGEAEEKMPEGDATRGLTIAKENHCGACHAGLIYDPAALPTFEAIADKSWESAACYDSGASHLNLPKGAGASLEAFRKVAVNAMQHDTPAAYAHRQFENLRCDACHNHDGDAALLASVHPESAPLAAHVVHDERLEQSIPALTHVGEMLHTDALVSMLSGKTDPRPRPWLDARMPGFANHSPEVFARGFAAQHGLAPSTAGEPKDANEELASIGKDLLGTEKGFGCITCHAVGDQAPTAAFEVKGINLDMAHDRLREGYFYHWMNDPTRITPGTKMPRYADDKGKTNLPALDGDARAQFEAIREYLEQVAGAGEAEE